MRPFNTLTATQHKALSSKGGKASGEARRAKREQINTEKAKAIAEKELRGETIYLLREEIRELKLLSREFRR